MNWSLVTLFPSSHTKFPFTHCPTTLPSSSWIAPSLDPWQRWVSFFSLIMMLLFTHTSNVTISGFDSKFTFSFNSFNSFNSHSVIPIQLSPQCFMFLFFSPFFFLYILTIICIFILCSVLHNMSPPRMMSKGFAYSTNSPNT